MPLPKIDPELIPDWPFITKGIIKAELKRRNLTYADLVERLGNIGVDEDERNIRNKLSRGTFTAVFFIQCMVAIGVKSVSFDFVTDEDHLFLSKLRRS